MKSLLVQTYRQGRVTTCLGWFGWLEAQGGIEKQPMVAVLAALLAALTGRAADAERWADVVDRWERSDESWADNPAAEAWAALLQATLCRPGVEQMQADAVRAISGFAAGFVDPGSVLLRGIAQLLSGDIEGSDTLFERAASAGEAADAPDVVAIALCERSLLAMARGDWSRAEALAGQACACLRQGGVEDIYATPLVCAVRARLIRPSRSTAAQPSLRPYNRQAAPKAARGGAPG